MLAPAMLMVVIALGAIAIDFSLMHAAKRSAYRSLSAAADDAASMVDSRHLLTTGEIELDQAAARRVALAHLGLIEDPPAGLTEPVFDFVGGPDIDFRSDQTGPDADMNVVEITATVEVDHILLSAIPGMGERTRFEMHARGRMVS